MNINASFKRGGIFYFTTITSLIFAKINIHLQK